MRFVIRTLSDFLTEQLPVYAKLCSRGSRYCIFLIARIRAIGILTESYWDWRLLRETLRSLYWVLKVAVFFSRAKETILARRSWDRDFSRV